MNTKEYVTANGKLCRSKQQTMNLMKRRNKLSSLFSCVTFGPMEGSSNSAHHIYDERDVRLPNILLMMMNIEVFFFFFGQEKRYSQGIIS